MSANQPSKAKPRIKYVRYDEADLERAFRRGQIQMRQRIWRAFRGDFAYFTTFKAWASWVALPGDPKRRPR